MDIYMSSIHLASHPSMDVSNADRGLTLVQADLSVLTILINQIINDSQGYLVQYLVLLFFTIGLDHDDNEEGEMAGVVCLSIWASASSHHKSCARRWSAVLRECAERS